MTMLPTWRRDLRLHTGRLRLYAARTSLRLCRFIEKEKEIPNKKSDCLRSARLITLGVRIGGSDAFRPTTPNDESGVASPQDVGVDGRASTYFEYDPYPVRSSESWAFRIADAPSTLKKNRNEKALYYLRLRPGGMRIYAASIGEKPELLAYPTGDDEYLRSAPLVVAVNNGGETEDWFIWWQQLSLEGTAGRIVAIAPGRATTTDWLCLGAPDRSSIGNGRLDCRETTNALLVAKIGKKDPEDPRFSEIWPASGGSESNELLLAALTTHTCMSDSNIPCFVYVRLDGGGQAVRETGGIAVAVSHGPPPLFSAAAAALILMLAVGAWHFWSPARHRRQGVGRGAAVCKPRRRRGDGQARRRSDGRHHH